MSRVVLISDINTELGYNLLKQYYVNGYRILGFATTDLKQFSLKEFKQESIEILEWNRTSPVGLKNLLLRGITKFKSIDEVVIVQSAVYEKPDIKSLSVLDINSQVDIWIKGNFLLLKELINYFSGRNSGNLTLVNNIVYSEGNYLSPLGEIIEASFKSLMKNLFKISKEYNIKINGIESKSSEYNTLSEYIFNTVLEKGQKSSGKLFYHSDRRGFFNAFSR